MNEFIQLRSRARDKRDKLIALARKEYEATLVQIATLEQDLLGKVSSKHKSISASIESVIPSDRSFTTLDILTSLEALDPGRVWRRRSVDGHLFRLRERGLLRRVSRHNGAELAVYVRAGVEVPEAPTADMTLLGVIERVLVKPMTATEVAVAVVEAGYQSTMTKAALRNHVASALSRGKFTRQGGKWVKCL